MTRQPPSDEMLMAFADGELTGDEARAVEAAIAADPDLAARVETFRETARHLAALSLAQDDTLPDALVARVRELAAASAHQAQTEPAAPVVDLAAHRARAQATTPARAPVWRMPLAASILLALGLWGGFLLGQRQDMPGGVSHLAVLDSAELDQALRGMRSGERQVLPGGGDLSLIASFLDGDGRLCREFELDREGLSGIVSVACHPGEGGAAGWSTQLAILTPAGDAAGYAPASSLEVLDQYLRAIEAGPPLSADEEIAALDGLD